ncbi:MAG TPA: hypothetical protein VFM18_07610 [Methanosarcina sp.]|nr:hypothetical protein [Methanosarcina sp.]
MILPKTGQESILTNAVMKKMTLDMNLILVPVGIAYFLVAASLFLNKKYWLACVFVCYALSNIGLFMVAKEAPDAPKIENCKSESHHDSPEPASTFHQTETRSQEDRSAL